MADDVDVQRTDPSDPTAAEALLDLDLLVWADPVRAPREVLLRNTPTRAGFLATRGGEPAGLAGSWDVEVAVPAPGGGASLRPAEGLTWVGVHPDHRRRGVLSALMRHHLRWTRQEQGRAISVLKASEPGIYGRYGYGVASSSMAATFDQGTTFAAPPRVRSLAEATTTRTVTATAEQAGRLREVLARASATGAGHLVRSREDFERILTDVPATRGDTEPTRLMWATRDGEDVGVAWFARTAGWADANPKGTVNVILLATVDTGARLALARRLTGFDLMVSTTCWVGVDDPLALWRPSLRALPSSRMTDNLWLRLVDLPGAVAERGHATDVDVVVAVRDEVIGDNAGTWRWTARDGSGELVRTEDAPEVGLDVADLGAVWLGGQTLGARAAAGYVTEHRPGAVAALDAALRTPVGPCGALDF